MHNRFLRALALVTALWSPVCFAQTPAFTIPTIGADAALIYQNGVEPRKDWIRQQLAVIGSGFTSLPSVNLANYNPDPSGATDSCPAAAQAIAALPAIGGSLSIGPGAFLFASNCLDNANKPYRIVGQPGATLLAFSSATLGAAGVHFIDGGVDPFEIDDLQIVSTVPQTLANAAITVNYTNRSALGTGGKLATFQNLVIGYANDVTNYWKVGINCNSCANSVADNVNIHGKNEGNPGFISSNNMDACILETGFSTTFSKFATTCIFSNYGEHVTGDSEGNQEFADNFIGVNWGWVYEDNATLPDSLSLAGAPGPEIEDANVAAYEGGFLSRGWTQTLILGSSFYKRPDSTQNYVTASFLQGTYGSTTVGSNLNYFGAGNQIYGFLGLTPGGTAEAIKFDAYASGNKIDGNLFLGLNNAIDFGGGTGYEEITNNEGDDFGTGWALSQGSACGGILWKADTPVLLGAVTTDAALQTGATVCVAPGITSGGISSIQGQTSFITANSGTTTITTIKGGIYGEQITITGNDGGNTTLQQNSTIILRGGTNALLANGDSVTLVNGGAYWREIARNF